jgi:LacI family transcriptional regulator
MSNVADIACLFNRPENRRVVDLLELVQFVAARITRRVILANHSVISVGINNRMAGRSAAWAIAHCAGQPGMVGVLIGSHGYLGQEEREIGFRSYFRAKALDFKVLEPIVCFDEPENAYKQTIELLKTSDGLVGLYSVGGGNNGIIRAIEESRISRKLAYVCHELTQTTRAGLSAGVVDVVLAHDVPELARATLKMLVDIKSAVPNKKQSSIVPFAIYTSENI